jgi:hypothetical protein
MVFTTRITRGSIHLGHNHVAKTAQGLKGMVLIKKSLICPLNLEFSLFFKIK